MKLHFKTNEKGNLDIGGADALELAQKYGTPLYVTNEMRVRNNYQRVYQAFSKSTRILKYSTQPRPTPAWP